MSTEEVQDERLKEYGEPCLLPLVDALELLHELGDRMELPKICKTDFWERCLPWRRDICLLLQFFFFGSMFIAPGIL